MSQILKVEFQTDTARIAQAARLFEINERDQRRESFERPAHSPAPESWHRLTGAERAKRHRIKLALESKGFLPRPKK